MSFNFATSEVKLAAAALISGGRAVSINSSGMFQIAQAGTASTMPAVAFAPNTILSGQVGNARWNFHHVATISGAIGNPIFVGATGAAVNASGSLLSGNVIQVMGAATPTGAFINI